MRNTRCMICRGPNLARFIDLGAQPNGNHFPGHADLQAELRFPLTMAVCTDCWLIQLEEFPTPEYMFSNHPYITGMNMPVIEHFDRLVADCLRKFPLDENSLVLDIGANDGTLLGKFRQAGMRVLGVDPGKRTGELARRSGITVCETFWDLESARALKRLNLRPQLITATAVFYHVADIHSFVEGLAELLDDRGVFLAQCVYAKDVIEKLQFDHFYHEHTMIHALAPLQRLFREHGMRLLDVEFYDVHGGSFILFVGREGSPHPTSAAVERAIQAEKAAALDSLETYRTFARRVESNKAELLALLNDLRAKGRRVYALGAPLKGSTLLNYYGIGPDLVELATEVNRFKIGRFTPGTHIPIVYEEALERQPDYYLVLSWNFADFFLRKYASFLRAGGKFILPHPKVRVVGAEAIPGS